ncbi:MAG: MG2 domain-containing protein, partial [bacterium]
SGNSFVTEKQYADAINAWKVLQTRFPQYNESAEARYQTGFLLETQTCDLAGAIESYRGVQLEPWRSMAAGRIAVMEQKSLVVITPRVFRTNEAAKLKISTRNIEKLNFSAYRIDPESYFRKKQILGVVEQLDIGLVKPDAEWSADVPGQSRYKPVDSEYELKGLKMPGVWVVKVTDDKTFQATTMVIGSDLDAIIKTSRDQLLVYSQNMLNSTAKPGTRVLVSDGQNILMDEKTGNDGVLLKDWPGPRGNRTSHRLLLIDGDHVATTSAAEVPAVSARALSARAMILTDRPAYRPGQKVELRGIVREISQSRYSITDGTQYTLEVADSRGRNLLSRQVKVSRFGTFAESVPLD